MLCSAKVEGYTSISIRSDPRCSDVKEKVPPCHPITLRKREKLKKEHAPMARWTKLLKLLISRRKARDALTDKHACVVTHGGASFSSSVTLRKTSEWTGRFNARRAELCKKEKKRSDARNESTAMYAPSLSHTLGDDFQTDRPTIAQVADGIVSQRKNLIGRNANGYFCAHSNKSQSRKGALRQWKQTRVVRRDERQALGATVASL